MTLHELIEAGDVTGLKDAIAAGGGVNHSFPDSDECLLSAAAYKGDADLVQLLLDLGADPNNRNSVTPPLLAAVQSGSLESVRALIKAGADVNTKDEDSSTPLIDAAAGGHQAITQELLTQGANPKLKDSSGNSAVFYAAQKKHEEILELLLPLSTPKEREKVRIRIEIEEQNIDEKLVVDFMLSVVRGETEIVLQKVHDGTVMPDVIDRNGTSALMHAANSNRIDIVQCLVKKNANINRIDIYGQCPLTYAAMGCHPEMFEFLYELSDKKLRKRAEKIKQEQIAVGNWPTTEN